MLYELSKKFVVESYSITNELPSTEKFGMISQVRRAALSVHLNIAEGASRRSLAERKRYYEIARGSLIEIDAALDIAMSLDYLRDKNIAKMGNLMVQCFKILTTMIQSNK